jgi:uncharacterized protein DUF4365
MDENAQKEQFSEALVRAIAAAGGYAVYMPSVDDDSIDIGIASRGAEGTSRAPRLEMQLKCTSQNLVNNERIAFPLKIKNYNDLRDPNCIVPRILVVVLVPSRVHDWPHQTPFRLACHHCGYWASLLGYADTSNETHVTVPVPLSQRLDVSSLTAMMTKIGNGGKP